MKAIDPNASLDQLLRDYPDYRWLMEKLGSAPDENRARSLADVCGMHGLDLRTTARIFSAFRAGMPSVPAVSVELMTLTELCDHLERGNHARLRAELVLLDRLTETAAERYAKDDPALLNLRENFVAFRKKFAAHLYHEVEMIFPIIRRLDAGKSGTPEIRGSLKTPLARMEKEHHETDECL